MTSMIFHLFCMLTMGALCVCVWEGEAALWLWLWLMLCHRHRSLTMMEQDWCFSSPKNK